MLLVLAMTCLLLIDGAQTAPQPGLEAAITCRLAQGATSISLLASPDFSGRAIGSVPCGSKVIIRNSDHQGWPLVTFGKVEGYVNESFIDTSVGLYRVGGSVSAPKAISAPDPQYSVEALRDKIQGDVALLVIVGPDGRIRDVRVQRGLGHGLDEKAMETVRTWSFEPAKKDGVPVAVQIGVTVHFRLYGSPTQPAAKPITAATTAAQPEAPILPGVDRQKFPLTVVVRSSSTDQQWNGFVANAEVTIIDGFERKDVTISCRPQWGRCGHLSNGMYPAKWHKGKLEIIGYLSGGNSKLEKTTYAVTGEPSAH